jgi:hypothetical protein
MSNEQIENLRDIILLTVSILITLFLFDVYLGTQIIGVGSFSGIGLHFYNYKFSSLCNSIEVEGLYKALGWYLVGWILAIPLILAGAFPIYYFIGHILLKSHSIKDKNKSKIDEMFSDKLKSILLLLFLFVSVPQLYQYGVIKYIEPVYYMGDTYCEQLLNWEELMDKEDKAQQ